MQHSLSRKTLSEPIITNLRRRKYKVMDKFTNSFIILSGSRQPARHRTLFSSVTQNRDTVQSPVGGIRVDHIFLEGGLDAIADAIHTGTFAYFLYVPNKSV